MPATSRWVLFDDDAATAITAKSSNSVSGTGTVGYLEGYYTTSGEVSIAGNTADQFQIKVDGIGSFQQITLASGTSLDARAVARDINFKIKQLVVSGTQYDQVHCAYLNNKFRIYSSSLTGSSKIEVAAGTRNCLHLLGMAASQGGAPETNSVSGLVGSNNAGYGAAGGQFSISGSYVGQHDDVYVITIGNTQPIGEATPSAGYVGTCSTGGWWNNAATATYTITIDSTNGTTLNQGDGNVPKMTWVATGITDTCAAPVELLFSDYWYNVGTQGLRVKFSDAPIANNTTFTIICTPPSTVDGSNSNAAVGTAKYHWGSMYHGKSVNSSPVLTAQTYTHFQKGISIAWSYASGTSLYAGDKFRVLARGPQPTTLGVTLLNFGSVTVSTYSPSMPVWFELLSGARTLTNCKFGLQSHGTAQHHNQGESLTYFSFGTVGAKNPGSYQATEWKQSLDPSSAFADSSNNPPNYLNAVKQNLSVVSTAALSESVGVLEGNMVSDFIYPAIKLAPSEVGSNSSIVYRMFYDYSY